MTAASLALLAGFAATCRAEWIDAPLVRSDDEILAPFTRLRDRTRDVSGRRDARNAALFASPGKVLKIVQASDRDPVLTTRARELTEEELRSPEIQALIDDMIKTMHHAWGVGLAGPQVGRGLRLAIASVKGGPIVIVNPRLSVTDAFPYPYFEGCLSKPAPPGTVPRVRGVRVEFLDRHGAARSLELTGSDAVVAQHEFDHLDGILYPERVRRGPIAR